MVSNHMRGQGSSWTAAPTEEEEEEEEQDRRKGRGGRIGVGGRWMGKEGEENI